MLEALAPSSQYTVTAELQGFPDLTRKQIRVLSGQTFVAQRHAADRRLDRSRAGRRRPRRSSTSRARSPARTSRCELTESLPTGRSYQSYLQLVPGVMPDDQQQSGNPAARSGLNYSDIGGNVGISADNVYYFDGIDVTDPSPAPSARTSTPRSSRNSTSSPAPFRLSSSARPGLISNVITKSGSNSFHGSANYFFQNDNLVAENKHASAETFSTKDSAFTVGGPIVRDKAWFFGSYRYLNRKDDVSTLDTNEFMRTVDNTQHQGFAKGSWAVDQRRPAQRHLPERPDRDLRPPPARHHQRARPRPRAGRRAATAAPTPASGAARCSKSAPTSTTAKSPTSRRSASRATTCCSRPPTRAC